MGWAHGPAAKRGSQSDNGMPVPTDTLWNIKRLNAVFAVSAVVLLVSTLWLVVADHTRAWRGYQQQGRSWEAAMAIDAAGRALSAAQEKDLKKLEQRIEQVSAELQSGGVEALSGQTIAEAEQRIADLERELGKMSLPAAAVKGQIGPLTQQLERAVMSHGEGSEPARALREKLDEVALDFEGKNSLIVEKQAEVSRLKQGIRDAEAVVSELEKERAELTRQRDTLIEKIAALAPQGAAGISERVRNAPLLDWFNPSEKVRQVVVPDVRTDLNFLTVETIDRCNTCHVNIDNPAFEPGNLVGFVELQVASYEGQDVDAVDRPVVMVGFWVGAAEAAGVPLEGAQAEAVERINALRGRAGMEPLGDGADLAAELERIAGLVDDADAAVRVREWQLPARGYAEAVKAAIEHAVGGESFDALERLYRVSLIERYNGFRADEGLGTLSTDSVMLGHPGEELYAHPESAHPIQEVGCTSCHEGSGEETLFEHTAHMPREVWVDAKTGAVVPDFLVGAAAGEDGSHGGGHAGTDGHEVVEAGYTHDDVKLTGPGHPAPFAPVRADGGHAVSYTHPGRGGESFAAVRQADYWGKRYGWHAIHFMHWEKPMHALDYIESSCNKCHEEIYDIAEEAPRLFEGRQLFAQVGCINCHAVESLEDDLDIKKVGPSLAHVKEKLSASMTASWVWAPKAFRPMTKMPHYFMLENNSAPVDILRTRTEVTAITHFLRESKPGAGVVPYRPVEAPEDPGDVAAGRALFKAVGCVACHTNMTEDGEGWILTDLAERAGLDEGEAKQKFEAMSYNQRHVYALEHLEDRIERTGPELSGVGTKLKAGRTEGEARRWLYDWLINPSHYSGYTIMPSFRLSETEANDLTAYLLTLERPGYEADAFGFDEAGRPALDGASKAMLAELVAQIESAGGTLADARDGVAAMSDEQMLSFLGKKMVAHYGCNGCHQINEFEQAASACTDLNEWGLKDPHKLDFGYFDHMFDREREQPSPVWKVAHEGLEAGAPQVTHASAKIGQRDVKWEVMDLERRPWLYHKLHNPRVYDRGRAALDGSVGEGGGFDVERDAVGRAYDKLKMPKFFLNDRQVRAITTYVTSIRRPLVSEQMRRATADDAKMRVIRGRQLAALYNCYGCHNIEGNEPRVWESFAVRYPDGGINYENLNNAPPSLFGQGSKTQPDWLFDFLLDVRELRPWLDVRMPSFPMTDAHAGGLSGYFAGWSQGLSQRLTPWLDKVEAYRGMNPGDKDWFTRSGVAREVAHLKAFALMADLARARDFDEQTTSLTERRVLWERVVGDVRFLEGLNDVAYPYTQAPAAEVGTEAFVRGEALFRELRCYQCHALGEEDKLLELWKLDNPDAGAVAAFEDDGDGYEDEYGDEEDDYGGDDYGGDDYGGDEGGGEAAPVGPVYTAPNLSHTAFRLRWDWVDAWMQEPNTIQPGTKMPQWFAGGHSAFSKYPVQVKGPMETKYGYSGEQQREFLMGYLYSAGRWNVTPSAERLYGVEPEAVELAPLERPVVEAVVEGGGESADAGPESGSNTGSGTEGTKQAGSESGGGEQAAVEAPVVVAAVIEGFHEEATAAYDGGGMGRVVGVVRFGGDKAPRRKPVRMGSDAFCDKAHRGERVLSDSLVVNDDMSVQNVFVHVKGGLVTAQVYDPPGQAAVLDQAGCLYVPHVLGVQVGQELKILNSDNTLHNVNCQPKENSGFNEGMPVKGMEASKRFTKAERGVPFKCDVHPWMKAYVHVVSHPYFFVSDAQGRFEIKGLPAGTYTLEAVHESDRIEPVEFEITVEADASRRTDVTIGG